MAKKSKLVLCKHCGQEIAASAKTCPQCGGKNKKPIFKRIWFWVLVFIVLIAVIGGGDSENDSNGKKIGEVSQQGTTEKDKKDDNKEKSQSEEEDVQDVYHVGDILKDGDTHIVYVASGEYEDDNEFIQPAEGNQFIFMKFAFINTSEKSDSSVSFYSFNCYADGYAVDAHYNDEEDLSATLSAGRSTEGCVYFEVPKDAKEIVVEYETNWITEEKITFVYDGDKDSGYVLEKNTDATEGALQVGESLEGDVLNMKYVACFEDDSDNMFIEPKKGYRFITCEFEFENTSDSDQSVSAFTFDCFADGISCDATFFRDDSLSATLSSGKKAKGTVTFEVPKDATTIEVEYLDNFWTSDRIVFNASEY